MQADRFYQTNSDKALPLYFLTKANCLDGTIEKLYAFERNCLTTQQFKGAIGDVVMISGSDGLPCHVYIGSGDGQETLAIAAAVTRLPGGS